MVFSRCLFTSSTIWQTDCNRLHCIGAWRSCETKNFYFLIYCSSLAWETNVSFRPSSHLWKNWFWVVASSSLPLISWGPGFVGDGWIAAASTPLRASLDSDWCATRKTEMERAREREGEKSLCRHPEHSLKMSITMHNISKPPPAEIVSKYNPEASTPRSPAPPACFENL